MRGWHWACAHRPDATFDYTHELPANDFVVLEADSGPLYDPLWAGRLAGRPSVLALGVHAGTDFTPDGWRRYCTARRDALDAAGLLAGVLAVQVSEELYVRTLMGQFDTIIDPSLPWAVRADVIAGWLDVVAIPVARDVFQRPVTALEPYWSDDRTSGDYYRPAPRTADVLGIDAYVPAWAIRTGQLVKAFDWFVKAPVLRALTYGKPVHLVGQAFVATAPDDLWGETPTPDMVDWTRQLATTRGVLALSWFAWSAMPGLLGARNLAPLRAAVLA